MAGRPRRTRIYGANYDIGQSYYKSALDNLDKKQHGSLNRESSPFGLAKPNRNIDDLLQASPILKKPVYDVEEPLFDYVPKEPLLSRKSMPPSLPMFDDDEPEEEIRNSMRRLAKLKQRSPSPFLDDFTAIKEKKKSALELGRFSRSRAILDLDDFSSSMGSAKASAKSEVFKSTTTTTSASLRANATKERLANIEYEMSERHDKQAEREKRSANLKKFMNETGIEASSKIAKKVTF